MGCARLQGSQRQVDGLRSGFAKTDVPFNRFSPPVETEYSRELQRRVEAGRRRVASGKGRNLCAVPT
jgi:hypothetical protein